MKNLFLSLVLNITLAAIMQMFLPWWIIVFTTFAVAWFVEQKSVASFVSGFLSIAILWVGYAWYLSQANDHILAERVTALLSDLTKNSLAALFSLTAIIGGLVGGMSSLSGSLLKKALV